MLSDDDTFGCDIGTYLELPSDGKSIVKSSVWNHTEKSNAQEYRKHDKYSR